MRLVPDTVGTVVAYVLLFGSRKRPLAYRVGTHDPWPLTFDAADRDYLLDARLLHCGGYLHFDSGVPRRDHRPVPRSERPAA